jgi:hypothetical protein
MSIDHSSPNIFRVIKSRNEMAGACSTYGGEEKYILGFGGGNLRERGHLEDPGIDARIILSWICKKWGA